MRDSRAGDHLNQFNAPEPSAFSIEIAFYGDRWVADFNSENQPDIAFTQAEGASLPIALIKLASTLQTALSRTKSGEWESVELAKRLGVSPQEAITILTTFHERHQPDRADRTAQ